MTSRRRKRKTSRSTLSVGEAMYRERARERETRIETATMEEKR